MITQNVLWSDAGNHLPVDKRCLQEKLVAHEEACAAEIQALHAYQDDNGYERDVGSYTAALHAKKRAEILSLIYAAVLDEVLQGHWHLLGRPKSRDNALQHIPPNILRSATLPPNRRGILRTYPKDSKRAGAELDWFEVQLFPRPFEAIGGGHAVKDEAALDTQQQIEAKLSKRSREWRNDMPMLHRMHERLQDGRAGSHQEAAEQVAPDGWQVNWVRRLALHYKEWRGALREGGVLDSEIRLAQTERN